MVYFTEAELNEASGITHAGIALVAADAKAVMLAQREWDETDDPEVRGTWEFPGGHIDPGEGSWHAALREYDEEVGSGMVGAEIPLNKALRPATPWVSPAGNYLLYIVVIPEVIDYASWSSTDEVQNVGWFTREQIEENENLRPEVRDSAPWDLIFRLVSGNEERMSESTVEMEPNWDETLFVAQPIPVHGVIAPEDVPTGDGRGFNAGSMTRRPLRLPFSHQKVSISGHDGSVVVGSVDRIMRKNGLIHWEGSLMPSPETEELLSLMEFFGGRYGVSVDGDNGSVDKTRSKQTGQMWFDAIRAAGLTAVAIPAFYEAYVAFGYNPEMPEFDSDDVIAASGLAETDIVGARVTFDRGAGWLTNPTQTRRLHDYWMPGHPGGDKIAWGTPGDFRRARALIGEKIAKNSPSKMRYLNQIIAQWHHDALGYWPGDLDKPGNKTSAEARAERKAKAAARGIVFAEQDENTVHIVQEGGDLLPEEGTAWEAVLVSSAAGPRATPPVEYFARHPDTNALTIEEPDEFGLRRTYGYVAERGVCHVGISGRCVEPPIPADGQFPEFHLGRTKTKNGYINTGVLTYLVDHRDAQTILSETPEQQHYDNVANAWAAVRLGVDDRGIWFSGVVLPKIDDEDCVLLEAAGQVSGEWKYGSLRAAQAVNVPGYPVQRASAAFDDEGNVTALVAVTTGRDAALVASINGVENSECYEKSPKARMEALRKIDDEIKASTRMDALRAQWASRKAV